MTCVHGMGRPVECCETCDLGDALDVAREGIAAAPEMLALLREAMGPPDTWAWLDWKIRVAELLERLK